MSGIQVSYRIYLIFILEILGLTLIPDVYKLSILLVILLITIKNAGCKK